MMNPAEVRLLTLWTLFFLSIGAVVVGLLGTHLQEKDGSRTINGRLAYMWGIMMLWCLAAAA
jgi:hypothetical protein